MDLIRVHSEDIDQKLGKDDLQRETFKFGSESYLIPSIRVRNGLWR